MAEIEKTVRRRVNVSQTVKGIKTWEATVEITNGTEAELLNASDDLVLELEKRYPAQIEGGK